MLRILRLVSILIALLVATEAGAAVLIRGYVVANGGTPSTVSSAAGKVLLGTAGQAAVGVSSGATRKLCHGFWCFGGSRVVSVDDHGPSGAGLPDRLDFGPPSPNPSRAQARMVVALPAAAQVDLALYDVGGRRVRELFSGGLGAGYHTFRWDGSGERGGGPTAHRLPGELA